MRKHYAEPQIEVIEIEIEDVLCQSGDGTQDYDDGVSLGIFNKNHANQDF